MFIQYNENPRDNFRAGDCVVRAISVVTGESWEKIYVELCAEGYFMGDWGNNNAVWDAYLRRRGFKRYICPNDCSYCYSVADFANEHPEDSYERGRSNRRSYGRIESRDDFMDRFEELMDEAPDEATRKKFERLMMEMK